MPPATVTALPETTLSLPSGQDGACDPLISLDTDADPPTAEGESGTYQAAGATRARRLPALDRGWFPFKIKT